MLYSLQDITLIPAQVSNINSRSECNPYDDYNRLPLFTAPMSQVIDDENWQEFGKYVHTIIPRNIPLEKRLELCIDTFCAFSLDEFEEYFIYSVPEDSDELFKNTHYVLVDVANGHMKRLIDACQKAKEIWWKGSLVLMAGNVANPATYRDYSKAGVDYIRCSIGSGSQCTTANTGIYYPMASLLFEMVQHKNSVKAWFGHPDSEYKSIPKIVADGGFNTFGDIIKALALGADYVMCGKIFAQTVEACGKIHYEFYPAHYNVLEDGPFNEWIRTQTSSEIKYWKCYREYYGMSTKRAQKEFGKEGNKTEEGVSTRIPVQYTLEEWITSFTDYLRSAMSYTNSTTLSDFIGNVKYEILSPTAIRTFE